jgi:hypothetical protein
MDPWEKANLIHKGFEAAIGDFCNSDADLLGSSLLSDEEFVELGRQAARLATAPLQWAAAVGDRWDTTRTTSFLRVSRQALYKRIQNGTVLALPGRGTSWFPVWQFDPDTQLVRHVVGKIIGAFRQADDQVSPLVIAAWATAPNRLLEETTPAQWITEGRNGSDNPVVAAARRAARGLAS